MSPLRPDPDSRKRDLGAARVGGTDTTSAPAASVASRTPAAISDSEVRTEQVLVRLTPREKALLADRAADRRMSMPDYLRLCFEAAELQEAHRG